MGKRRGRHRRQNVRRDNHGDVKKPPKVERDKTMRDVVLDQPHRRGEMSQLVESALGRLRHSERISIDQYNDATTYASLASRHMRYVLGSTYRWPKSAMASIAGGGTWASMDREPDPEAIAQIEREWADVMSALADHGLLRSGVAALAHICLMDMDPTEAQLGDARLALNVLHRLYGANPKRRWAPFHAPMVEGEEAAA